jgi:hypothetical protein
MQLSTLSPGLLYALLSINPAAVSTLAGLPSTSAPSTAAVPVRQNTYIPPTANPTLSRRSSLSHRTFLHRRQVTPTGLVNATVTCRDGEFQNPDDDIAFIVCGQYYKCGDGTEAEQTNPNGAGGTEALAWTATCTDCVGGQPADKASGCVWTEM